MYALRDFAEMIADGTRMRAYEAALARAVKPGSVVVDLGAGPGMFTLLACRMGARKVYAIDPNPAIDVARAMVRDNGFGDRVQLISKMSTEVELPERADVIVSDLRGVLPFFMRHMPSIADARARFLAPGGVLIPARDHLRVAVVDAPSVYATMVGPWESSHFGFDVVSARKAATSEWYPDRDHRIGSEQVLTSAETWATIDYAQPPQGEVAGTVSLVTRRAGVGHGLAVWFDAVLAEGIGFSNAPGTRVVYARGFFPWPEPVNLGAGARIEVTLSVTPTRDDHIFSWASRFHGTEYLEGPPEKEFRQTDFFLRTKLEDLARSPAPRLRA